MYNFRTDLAVERTNIYVLNATRGHCEECIA